MSDPRAFPLVELDRERMREMLRPLLCGAQGFEAVSVQGGLVNTLYRIKLDEERYALRVYARGNARAFEFEQRVLQGLRGRLPVPDILFASASGEHPYVVYRWIEGMTLNDCRRSQPRAALESLARPLGQLLARIPRVAFAHLFDAAAATERSLKIEALLSVTHEKLRRGRARKRLGAELADRLRRLLDERAVQLQALEDSRPLLHGDVTGRNIIVRREADDRWRINGLIDWESVSCGSPVWDVSSLFRYSKRYAEAFRKEFELGYREAGGALPDGWVNVARLLDAVRLVKILDDERPLPKVFAECRELIEALLAECGKRLDERR